MTMQPEKVVVADDVLASALRNIADLMHRLVTGVIDPQRCLHLLQLAKEGVPRIPHTITEEKKTGTYVLESEWSYFGETELEYLTLNLTTIESQNIEEMLKRPDHGMARVLKRHHNEHVGDRSGHRMRRLYRAYSRSRFARSSQTEMGTLRSTDLHFVMVPLCDFDNEGMPIPLTRKYDRV